MTAEKLEKVKCFQHPTAFLFLMLLARQRCRLDQWQQKLPPTGTAGSCSWAAWVGPMKSCWLACWLGRGNCDGQLWLLDRRPIWRDFHGKSSALAFLSRRDCQCLMENGIVPVVHVASFWNPLWTLKIYRLQLRHMLRPQVWAEWQFAVFRPQSFAWHLFAGVDLFFTTQGWDGVFNYDRCCFPKDIKRPDAGCCKVKERHLPGGIVDWGEWDLVGLMEFHELGVSSFV